MRGNDDHVPHSHCEIELSLANRAHTLSHTRLGVDREQLVAADGGVYDIDWTGGMMPPADVPPHGIGQTAAPADTLRNLAAAASLPLDAPILLLMSGLTGNRLVAVAMMMKIGRAHVRTPVTVKSRMPSSA